MKKTNWVGAAMVALAPLYAGAADLSPAMQHVAAATKGEPPLKLSWGASTMSGEKGATMAQDAMNKMFGTAIKVVFTPGPNIIQFGGQLATEFKAGKPAAADVYLAELSAVQLIDMGALELVDWKALLPGRITDDIVEANGALVRFTTMIAGITYNTRLLPKPPQTLAEVLKPEFKGKFATTPYAAGLDYMAASDVWGVKGTEWVRAFSGQVAGLMRCGEPNRIASGEFLGLVLDCGAGDAAIMKEKGAPLAQVIPSDYVMLRYFYLSVPKHAAAPNSAKAFVAFMMTPEGQKVVWDTWHYDLHHFAGSHSAQDLAEVEKRGGKGKQLTVEWFRAHPEAMAAREDVVKTIQSGGK